MLSPCNPHCIQSIPCYPRIFERIKFHSAIECHSSVWCLNLNQPIPSPNLLLFILCQPLRFYWMCVHMMSCAWLLCEPYLEEKTVCQCEFMLAFVMSYVFNILLQQMFSMEDRYLTLCNYRLSAWKSELSIIRWDFEFRRVLSFENDWAWMS